MRQKILVTGATGFVGQAVIRQLCADGHQVWAGSRSGQHVLNAQGVKLNITRQDSVTQIMDIIQPNAVIHLVGIIDEEQQSFEAVHVQGTQHILSSLQKGTRYLHMSALGADLHSKSKYSSTKARAEQLVQQASLANDLGATIFRPSLIFGEGDDFFGRVLKNLVSLPPVVPQIGQGEFPFAPVSVEDVALAFSRVLSLPQTKDKTYELTGPDIFTFRELLLLEMHALGMNKPLLPIPLPLMDRLVPLMGILPHPPITMDQYIMLKAGNVADPLPAAEAFDLPLIRLWPRLAELLRRT